MSIFYLSNPGNREYLFPSVFMSSDAVKTQRRRLLLLMDLRKIEKNISFFVYYKKTSSFIYKNISILKFIKYIMSFLFLNVISVKSSCNL